MYKQQRKQILEQMKKVIFLINTKYKFESLRLLFLLFFGMIDFLGSFTCLLVVLHLKRLFGYYLGEFILCTSNICLEKGNSLNISSTSLYSINAHCDPFFCFILDRS